MQGYTDKFKIEIYTIFFIGIYVMEDAAVWSNKVAINHLTSGLFNNIEPYLCQRHILVKCTDGGAMKQDELHVSHVFFRIPTEHFTSWFTQ